MLTKLFHNAEELKTKFVFDVSKCEFAESGVQEIRHVDVGTTAQSKQYRNS